MKQIYSILLSFFVVGLIGFGIFQSQKTQKTQKSNLEVIDYKEDKLMRIEKAFEQRYNAIKDPITGEVPSNELLRVYDYARTLEAQGQLRNGDLATAKWLERGPYQIGGRTRAILIDKNDPERKTVWSAGVSGGLWKSEDITGTEPNWEIVDDYLQNLTICAITQNPNNPQEMYFGTGEGYFGANSFRGQGIWKSSDGGENWTYLQSTNNSTFYFTIRLEVHPLSGHLFAATLNGLMRSTDGGNSWQKVIGSGIGGSATRDDITDLEIASDGTMYASSGHRYGGTSRVYVSSAGAAAGGAGDWQILNNFPLGRRRIELAVSESNPNVIYSISTGTNGSIGMHKSITAGQAWTSMSGPTFTYNDQAWYNLTIEVDPKNENRVVTGVLTNAISVDGGINWSSIPSNNSGSDNIHVDQHTIVYDDLNSDNLYLGNDGGIYACRNATNPPSGMKWINRNQRYNVTQFYACAIHPGLYEDYFLAGAQDNGTQRFDGFGLVNTSRAFGNDGAFCHIDQNDPQYQVVSWQNGNYLFSTNGGESFLGGVIVPGAYFINPSTYDSDSSILYALAGNGGDYYRASPKVLADLGTYVSIDNLTPGRMGYVGLSANTPNRLYLGLNAGQIAIIDNAHEGTNKSASFINVTNFGTVTSVIEEEGNPNHMVVTLGNYNIISVYESFDGGQSWQSVEGNLPNMPVNWAIFDPTDADKVLLATEAGVWGTENLDGANTQWLPNNNGMPLVRVDMLKYRESDNLIVAATHGRGLFTTAFRSPANARFDVEQAAYLQTNRKFINTSYNASDNSWDFGDGNTSTDFSPTHQYQNIGTYTSTLTINSSISQSKDIKILPDREVPYTSTADIYGGDFESTDEDFGVYTVSGTSWEKGNSTIAGKAGVKSGSNAWVTGLNDDWYEHNTESYLYTPNYDLSEPGIYEISFWANYYTQYGWDGFRVEYSTNRGESWQVLGDKRDNWYNFKLTSGGASFENGSALFTGATGGWEKYSYNMQEVEGFADVAFRFAFKSNATGRQKGVAIDDFQINVFKGELETVLRSFEGAFVDGNRADITWSTQPEYRCSHFELEISENAKDFTPFGQTQAQGSTINLTSYVSSPADLVKNLYYFRLKVVLENDEFFYSDIIILKRFDTDLDFQNVYPSPFTNYLDIAFNTSIIEETNFSLYDVTGKLVANRVLTPNSVYFRFDLPELAKGVYFLVVDIGDTRLTKKLLKR
ncbi:MAG: T9SS type A sorting domain-containing protein [Saprospiraceae bacterium]